METNNKILTVIVSYNFTPWLTRCLDSLRRSTLRTDVMVVDNASTDDTVARIRREYPEVDLRPQARNLGFGKANNVGMAHALAHGYRYVFLLNQDAWIDPDTLEGLAAAAGQDPRWGILSPIHLTGDATRMDRGFADYIGTDRLDAIPADPVVDQRFVNAAFWFIPSRVLREVGGFSPLFYHYGEDVDYVNRLHRHGYRLGIVHRYGCHDRDYRPTPHEKTLRMTAVYLLMEYANPLRPLHRAATLALGGGVKHALKALVRGQVGDAAYHLRTVIRLLLSTPRILRIRRRVQRKAPHFLNPSTESNETTI